MAASVESLLGEDAIRRIRLPIEQAGGLPRQAYISPEFFALERARLFPRTWMGIGFTSDVPDPGDAIPLMAAGVPIVLCRDKSGTLRAFHNVCRHRAARVLEKPAKNLNVFSCPYHAWAFGLDGALRAIPFFDGTPDGKGCSLDWSQNGLVPVRVATWHHWVFVNLDGQAPPLEEYLAPRGLFAGRELDHREEDDVQYGFQIAKETSRLDIGQTVVVKGGTVLAVEAFAQPRYIGMRNRLGRLRGEFFRIDPDRKHRDPGAAMR